MDTNYSKDLGRMQIAVEGDENQKTILDRANYIMAFGKLYVKNGKCSDKFYKAMVDEINNYQKEWTQIQNILFEHLNNYIEQGISNKYSLEYNDICYGTLTMLKEIYKNGTKLDYLFHDKLNIMIDKMQKICDRTNEYILNNSKSNGNTRFRRKNMINSDDKNFEDGNSTSHDYKEKKFKEKFNLDKNEF